MKIKTVLLEKEESSNGELKIINLTFYMSSDGGPENRAAFRYNPQGSLRLYGLTPEAAGSFECGKPYFIDIKAAS
jgi:hypothetical protein